MDPWEFANIVRRLLPGQSLDIEYSEIPDDLGLTMRGWSIPGAILEKIMGAAYEFSWKETAPGIVTFHREQFPLENGLYTCVSGDREHYFERLPNGLYRPLALPMSEIPEQACTYTLLGGTNHGTQVCLPESRRYYEARGESDRTTLDIEEHPVQRDYFRETYQKRPFYFPESKRRLDFFVLASLSGDSATALAQEYLEKSETRRHSQRMA